MNVPAPLLQLPNQLTVARIAAIPVICFLVGIGVDWLRWLALIIYVAAAVTDWLDGFLARRMNMQSDLGKMLDPIADKLLVGALIVTFAWTRDFWEEFSRFSSDGGVYLNFMEAEGRDVVKAGFAGNYERLAALKAKYDPGNLFHLNQNIRPAAAH